MQLLHNSHQSHSLHSLFVVVITAAFLLVDVVPTFVLRGVKIYNNNNNNLLMLLLFTSDQTTSFLLPTFLEKEE